MDWIEIPPPKIETNEKIVDVCPKCRGRIVFGSVPCPSGEVGCFVNHLGYICLDCGRQFAMLKEHENDNTERA